MSEITDPTLVRVCDSVDRITYLTVRALGEHRAADCSDDALVSKLWTEFRRASAENGSPDAGLLHMAVTCYKLALAEQKIRELEESLEFHRNAIDFMVELSDLD
jgi:hypothetical protein